VLIVNDNNHYTNLLPAGIFLLVQWDLLYNCWQEAGSQDPMTVEDFRRRMPNNWYF
jgi:hypothetical protein